MISYDNYKNRIMKLAKVRKFLLRFKYLIAGIMAVLVALSVGLMVGKGAFLSDMILPESITFDPYGGFEVKPAKAFLSSAKVEYSSDGEEWSADQPKRAGSFYARSVARKLSGYAYSEAVRFEIRPIDCLFDVTGDSVVYGEIPKYTVTNLYAGHRVAEEELDFEYENLQSESTVVTAAADTVKILGENGEDLTYCYNLSSRGKQLNILKRPIAVKPVSQTLLYSGKAADYAGEVADGTLSRLAKGDTLSVTTYTSGLNSETAVLPVNAADYVINVEGVKIMHGGTDVTAHYDISLLTAELKIKRNPIVALTADVEKPYDGTELFGDKVLPVSGQLCEGHAFSFDNQTLPSITTVGSLENRFDFEIVDENGTVVSENYQITRGWGTLKVTPREILVKTFDRTREYNGKPLFGDCYTTSALMSGYESKCTEYASITAVGSCENRMNIVIRKDGQDMTSNFRLVEKFGTLTVTPRHVKIKTGTAERVYNGTAQTETGCEVLSGSLADGQSFTVADAFSVTDVTTGGGEENTTKYAVSGGGEDVTSNYSITYEYGTITVVPRHIKVKTDDKIFVYDGNSHSHGGYTTALSSNPEEAGLIGAELRCLSVSSVSTVAEGEVRNICTYEAPSANYVIDGVEYGTLRVVPRAITIVTATDAKVYDGNPLINSAASETYFMNGESKEEGLLDGALTPLTYSSVTTLYEGDNGSIANDCTYLLPSENYEIEKIVKGTLTILPRRIIVTTATAEKEYDGQPLSNSEGYSTVWEGDGESSGLLGEDRLVVRSETTIKPKSVTRVGAVPVQNVCLYEVPNANYEIAATRYGTLKITPRNVLITTSSGSHIYDGNYYSSTEYEKTEYAVLDGEKWVADNSRPALIAPLEKLALKAGTQTEVRDVDDGLRENRCEYEDDGGCYALHYNYGSLSILPRPVTVKTHSNSWLFDGQQHSETGRTVYYYKTDDGGNLVFDTEGMVGGDDVVLSEEFKVLNATGEAGVANECKYSAPSSNYEIKATIHGTLTVSQRHVSVTTNTTSWTYDGTAHSDGGYTSRLTSNISEQGLVGGDKLVVDESTLNTITDFGTVTNEYTFSAPLYDGVHSNYVIDEENTQYGTLKINTRTLYIKTATASKDYDGKELFAGEPEKCYHLNSEGKEEFGLAEGHVLEVDTLYGVTNATDDEGLENHTTYVVVDGDGNPILKNYEIVGYDFGKLIVYRARLIVAVNNMGAIYGQEVFAPDGINSSDKYASVRNIAEKETLYISTQFTKNGAPVEPKDVGLYDISIIESQCRILRDGTETPNGMDNYTLVEVSGTLNISPLSLLCSFDKNTVTYGATYGTGSDDILEKLTVSEYAAGSSSYKLPYDEQLTLYMKYYDLNDADKNSVVPKDAGEYGMTGGKIVITGKEDGDKNYAFAFVDNVLEIKKKVIDINLKPQSVQYGDSVAETVGAEGYVAATEGAEIALPFDQSLSIKVGYRQNGKAAAAREVGDYETYVLGAVVTSGGNTVDECHLVGDALQLKNYTVNCGGSTLEIEKRQISLTIVGENKTRIYADNTPVEIAYGIDRKLAYDDTYFVKFKFRKQGTETFITTPREVGKYDILIDTLRFYDDGNLYDEYLGSGEIVFKNYNVTVEYAPAVLEIHKKFYDIIIEDNSVTYGASVPMDDIDYSVVLENGALLRGYLENGQKLVISAKYTAEDGTAYSGEKPPVNAGTYTITVDDYKIVDRKGEIAEGKRNYDLNFIAGKLKIEKSTLAVTPNDITVTYGDYNFGESDVYATLYGNAVGNYNASAQSGLQNGQRLAIKVKYLNADGVQVNPKDIGKYRIAIDLENSVFYDADGNAISNGAANYRLPEKGGEGVLTINRFVMDLDISDDLTVYSGDAAPEGEIISSYNGKALPYNEKLFVVYSYLKDGEAVDPVAVGEYVVKCNYVRPYEEGGVSLFSATYPQLQNYAFNLTEGRLNVIQR